jgi:hypothetical protein
VRLAALCEKSQAKGIKYEARSRSLFEQHRSLTGERERERVGFRGVATGIDGDGEGRGDYDRGRRDA